RLARGDRDGRRAARRGSLTQATAPTMRGTRRGCGGGASALPAARDVGDGCSRGSAHSPCCRKEQSADVTVFGAAARGAESLERAAKAADPYAAGRVLQGLVGKENAQFPPLSGGTKLRVSSPERAAFSTRATPVENSSQG